MIEKLGDNKQPVRDEAILALENVIAIVGAPEVYDKLLTMFGHKTWRLREQLAVVVKRSLEGPHARDLPLPALVKAVGKLLNDQRPDVRVAAMDALEEMYWRRGPKLRSDLEKLKIRPTQMKELAERFERRPSAATES